MCKSSDNGAFEHARQARQDEVWVDSDATATSSEDFKVKVQTNKVKMVKEENEEEGDDFAETAMQSRSAARAMTREHDAGPLPSCATESPDVLSKKKQKVIVLSEDESEDAKVDGFACEMETDTTVSGSSFTFVHACSLDANQTSSSIYLTITT
jgi:hypothetical protein